MIANLKTAFKSLVSDATWMDSDTKSIAKDKVDAMIEFVGYPPWIKNKKSVEDYYNGISRTSTGCHFCNVQLVSAYVNKIELASLRNKPDRNRWKEKPTIVNAFYSITTNSITFPAGILQAPNFTKGRSAAINYGALGSMIGDEITHGFDDQGRQSDKNGNTVQWWTEKTLEKYQVRAKCFIDQYSNYTVLNRTRLNGINTQGENIADNGGVREAFRAYRYYVAANGGTDSSKFENLTPEQVFFLAYANSFCGANTPEELGNLVETDPHSPHRFRVIGTLSNNEDFVREFKCGAGTPMNRLNKCVLW
ncbi:endothelin-converting enzyme 1-like [Daphnia pulex]|uniref:endothelin-converting enzyme 1-like n=1 Tax=Daphnia pulex TaxID=6669 RepID=UPI001EDDEF8C|nr:endothelin-converting enzyme 1-like [Daphnia pulex]XP_046461428.1 endothelin-converting enzyme 1-like [Daphnia pulex]